MSTAPQYLPRQHHTSVLIADDARAVRERLAALLEELPGITVVGQAATTSEALDAARQLAPDVVILDIRMPEGSGLDVLRTLKRHHSRLTVIILTNYGLPIYREKCREAGADFFFDKSTELDLLIATIDQIGRTTPPSSSS